jgi:hypothetical protein
MIRRVSLLKYSEARYGGNYVNLTQWILYTSKKDLRDFFEQVSLVNYKIASRKLWQYNRREN